MLVPFREIVLADFEYGIDQGDRPNPLCYVAWEMRSGRKFRIWEDHFGPSPPHAVGRDVLYVGFYCSGDLMCYRALGWPTPQRILDPFIEFRNHRNGLSVPAGWSLLGALTYFGLDAMGADEKKELQKAIGNGSWQERFTKQEVLDYCEQDVAALHRLLPTLLPLIDLPRALLRGRYMAAAAAMEFEGTPIDVETLDLLRENWTAIQDRLIAAIDVGYLVYEGRTFKQERFVRFLERHRISWPYHESGTIDLSDGTFRQMAKAHSLISPLRELRSSLSDLRLNDLAVGRDGRNRTNLSVFRSKSGRNQPSNSKCIFGPSVWIRGLIKPPPGYGVAYVDWAQQEVGIAAALSGDTAMQEAYQSGDCYLAFAKQARAVPSHATKKSHGAVRELYKQCVLGTQYGMGEGSLAGRIGQPCIFARDLLRAHRETYRKFWTWSDAALDQAMLHGSIHTVFGWTVHVGEGANPRSLRNFPMQANGAEMLRLACCLATERGVAICAPVHDAALICAPNDRLDADIVTMRAAMAEASRAVLNGFELRTECPDEFDETGKRNPFPQVVRYPQRYMDERGVVMWDKVMALIVGDSRDQIRTIA
ncbi:DNA polymerase-1 [Bradyrhizobium sp. LM2.7]